MPNETITSISRATVSRILLWYDGPVLAEMTASAPDGAETRLLSIALPEGAGWSHVVAAPSPERLDLWDAKDSDLRDLQRDPKTRHYLIGDADGAFGVGSEIGLTPLEGTPVEDWLCDAGLFVDDVDKFEKDKNTTSYLEDALVRDQEIDIGPEVRAAFRAPETVSVRPFRGDQRPAWLQEMGWDGTESVACGDRIYLTPGRDGFTLIASSTDDFRTGYPVGYLSADLTGTETGKQEVHVDMIQVDSDFRGERVGSALAAALAELVAGEISRDLLAGRAPSWEVAADTQSPAADAIIRRLQEVIDQTCDETYDPEPSDNGGVEP